MTKLRVIISKGTGTAYTSFKYSESLVLQVLVVCHMQVKRQPFISHELSSAIADRREQAAVTSCNLTLVLERTPFEPSIQMYSAMTVPFWSSFKYLSS